MTWRNFFGTKLSNTISYVEHTKPTAKRLLETLASCLSQDNMKEAVKVPEGESLNEWIAMNLCEFFNALNIIYGVIADFCTDDTCKVMNAGPDLKGNKFEYLWADDTEHKEPVKVSAPQYVNLLFGWVKTQLENPALFPIEEGEQFPPKFKEITNMIFRRLFRVYAHIYWEHYDKFKTLDADRHLNSCFQHFLFFCEEFNCVEKSELDVLSPIIKKVKAREEDKNT